MSLLDGIGATQLLSNGVAVVRRRVINYVGLTVVDDPVNEQTVITGGPGGPGGASDSSSVSNLSSVVGATVTAALNTLLGLVNSRATQAALDALANTVTGKAAQSAVDALTTAVIGKAPIGAEYIVRTLSTGLSAERALEGADGVTVDYSTPDKAIVRGPGAGATTPLAPVNTGTGTTAIAAASDTGSSANAARQDHTHAHGNLLGGALHAAAVAHTATPNSDGFNTTGGSAGFVTADQATRFHELASPGGAANTSAVDSYAGNRGTDARAARLDHTHYHGQLIGGNLHAVATPHNATPVGGVNTTGGANGFFSADAATKLAGIAPGAGASTPLAPTNTGTGTTAITTASNTGTSANAARQDHTHAHGAQTDPANHALAIVHGGNPVNGLNTTGGASGFFSADEKTRFASLVAGTPVAVGTANAQGASLGYARADHVHDASHLAPKLFEYVTNNAASLTLALTHLHKKIACTFPGPGAPQIVIPRDSTLNLPVGFACQVFGDVVGEYMVRVVSEVASGNYGIPARYPPGLQYSSASTTPWELYAGPFAVMTLEKIGPDKWLVTGAYAA